MNEKERLKQECKALRPRLQRFADGALLQGEAAEVRSHLLDCLSCRAIVGEVYSLRNFFDREAADVVVPAGFAARVSGIAFAEPRVVADPLSLSFLKTAVAVAAGITLLVGSLLFLSPHWERNAGMEVRASTRSDLDREIENLSKHREKAKSKKPAVEKKVPAKK